MITVKREASFLFVGKDISDAAQDGDRLHSRRWAHNRKWVQSPTADSWNGSTWTAMSPVNQGSTTLSEISCTSTTNCIAVGAYGLRGSVSAAAESWNGSTWTAQTVPDPAGSGYTVLFGVSCPSATDCSAVGWWESSSSSFPTVADQYTS
jgi:hypothetical protein